MKIILDKAYCVNLASRPERWERTVEEFKKLQEKLPVELLRVDAVAIPTNPKEGMGKSVKKIVEMAKEQDLDYFLMLEDDLHFLSVDKLLQALENAPDEWDTLSAGSYHVSAPKPFNEDWISVKGFCSMHFFIVRKTIYDKILQINCANSHMDIALSKLCARGIIKSYLMHPMPCQQFPGYSDIRQKQVNDNGNRFLPWLRN